MLQPFFLRRETGRVFVAVLAMLLAILVVQPASANPKYAAYVWDTNTGQVLFERNADETRFPASLTKIMTLYMVFQALDAGRISLASPIPVSDKAAAEVPSKLGMKPGGVITVQNAILSLVTRSANDMATALGELLGGTEDNFARLMTAKARQLGMDSTIFHNAHGLPDERQVTTARDMAILGYAIREHFPHHYHYFQTREFSFGGQNIGNHNRLLGSVTGVDGIKTGFTRASGFNLVTSVRRDGRSVVAVVMGGQTGASRDNHMAALIEEHLPRASARKTADLIVERPAFMRRVPVVFLMPDAMPVPEFRVRAAGPALVSKPAPANAAAANTGTVVDVRSSATGYAMPGGAGRSALPDESRVRGALGGR